MGADKDGLGLVEGSECVVTRRGVDSTVAIVDCSLTLDDLCPSRDDYEGKEPKFWNNEASAYTMSHAMWRFRQASLGRVSPTRRPRESYLAPSRGGVHCMRADLARAGAGAGGEWE